MKLQTLLAVALMFMAGAGVRAQTAASASASAADRQSQPAKSAAKEKTPLLKLEDVSPVNTEAAAQRVAQALAKRQAANAKKQAKDQASGLSHKKSGDNPPVSADAVTEFHAAPAESEVAAATGPEHRGRAAGDRVHGELYGSTGAAGHATAESVGAASKSGKTSVYVQTDQSRAASPQPQPH